ncbi:MAG: hybrid sensor histidine kinase/response regulator [Bacteroidia bacterium]
MSEKLRVLYVDDEENNLISFQAYFRKQYQIYTATSPMDAFELLKDIEMHIIVTDQKMPVMTGTEFLEKTVEKFPDSIRLLITGQADLDSVIEAINRGQVNKYVQKPWDWDKLKLILENCADLYKGRVEMKIKNIELQKTNDELNRFIYSASHDLRSPLMSILGIVQLAKMEENVNNEYFQIIENSVLKLDKYIRNIIDYYQNSRSDEAYEKIDFKELLLDVMDMLKNQDQIIKFETEVKQECDFIGDTFRLRVILSNVISNAIKYKNPATPQHIVTVKIITTPEDVQITLSDNGIGIQTEHIENIFKMFYRAQITNNKQGSGIGLFIVKESLDKIGGTITVDSKPNEGTSFHMVIPNKTR